MKTLKTILATVGSNPSPMELAEVAYQVGRFEQSAVMPRELDQMIEAAYPDSTLIWQSCYAALLQGKEDQDAQDAA